MKRLSEKRESKHCKPFQSAQSSRRLQLPHPARPQMDAICTAGITTNSIITETYSRHARPKLFTLSGAFNESNIYLQFHEKHKTVVVLRRQSKTQSLKQQTALYICMAGCLIMSQSSPREWKKGLSDLPATLLTTLSNGNLPGRYKHHYFWQILMVGSQKIVVCSSGLFVKSSAGVFCTECFIFCKLNPYNATAQELDLMRKLHHAS